VDQPAETSYLATDALLFALLLSTMIDVAPQCELMRFM
jgi:hypothetical protein